jgi:hypothetical protein
VGFFSCTVFVLSGRGLCEGPIPRPEESYRLWCVSECDRDDSTLMRPWPTGGCGPHWGCYAIERLLQYGLFTDNYDLKEKVTLKRQNSVYS